MQSLRSSCLCCPYECVLLGSFYNLPSEHNSSIAAVLSTYCPYPVCIISRVLQCVHCPCRCGSWEKSAQPFLPSYDNADPVARPCWAKSQGKLCIRDSIYVPCWLHFECVTKTSLDQNVDDWMSMESSWKKPTQGIMYQALLTHNWQPYLGGIFLAAAHRLNRILFFGWIIKKSLLHGNSKQLALESGFQSRKK